jgi:hypothetical protein
MIFMLVFLPILYPVLWLRDLPRTLRYRRLVRLVRRHLDELDLDRAVRVRWWTPEHHTMASGAETTDLFELELARGDVIVYEDLDPRSRERLAARGLLPEPVSLGSSPSALVQMFWFVTTCVMAFAIAVLRVHY